MIDSTGLKLLLNDIELLYQCETNPNKALLWAKIASLEVGGWTEECIDDILNAYIDFINPLCKTDLKDKLKRVYGFHFSTDFRNICVQILGNLMFEKIQNRIPLECQQLESALNMLKTNRDKYAHTHSINKSPIDSPQNSIRYLNQIEKGLKQFFKEIKKIRVK
jgi:hypothetical protein